CSPADPFNLVMSADHGFHKIINIQHISHLTAITIKSDGFATKRPKYEVRHPTLIFGSELMRTANAAHSENHGGQSECASVVQNILISGSFGTSIRTMEIK